VLVLGDVHAFLYFSKNVLLVAYKHDVLTVRHCIYFVSAN